MNFQLFIFCVKRFFLVFVCVLLVMLCSAYIDGQNISQDYLSLLLWPFLSAVIATSLSAYWGYKKQCKMVYKKQNK